MRSQYSSKQDAQPKPLPKRLPEKYRAWTHREASAAMEKAECCMCFESHATNPFATCGTLCDWCTVRWGCTLWSNHLEYKSSKLPVVYCAMCLAHKLARNHVSSVICAPQAAAPLPEPVSAEPRKFADAPWRKKPSSEDQHIHVHHWQHVHVVDAASTSSTSSHMQYMPQVLVQPHQPILVQPPRVVPPPPSSSSPTSPASAPSTTRFGSHS